MSYPEWLVWQWQDIVETVGRLLGMGEAVRRFFTRPGRKRQPLIEPRHVDAAREELERYLDPTASSRTESRPDPVVIAHRQAFGGPRPCRLETAPIDRLEQQLTVWQQGVWDTEQLRQQLLEMAERERAKANEAVARAILGRR